METEKQQVTLETINGKLDEWFRRDDTYEERYWRHEEERKQLTRDLSIVSVSLLIGIALLMGFMWGKGMFA